MYTHTHTQHTHTHIQVDVLVHTPVYKLLVHNIVRHENQSESAFLTCYLLLHYHTVEWCYTICMYTVYRTSTPNTYMHTPPPHKHTLNHPPPAHSAAWCRCSSPQTPSAYPSAPQTQQTRHWWGFVCASPSSVPAWPSRQVSHAPGWIWRTKLVEYSLYESVSSICAGQWYQERRKLNPQKIQEFKSKTIS